jgi:FKBP-type peptidyl-prolyl cis-trans isomerase
VLQGTREVNNEEEKEMNVNSGFRRFAIVAAMLMMSALFLTNCKTEKTVENKTTQSGLVIEELKVGTGAEAKKGQTVTVHYTGWLTNGTKFDSSRDRMEPFAFHLGAGEVIKGWDEGVQGMKVGGKRKLTIPASMGYGARGAGGVIPPNATLVFDVELLKVQ